MTITSVPVVTAADVTRLLTPAAAAAAITAALKHGLNPPTDPQRVAIDLAHGQLLLMPARTSTSVGVKVATVAPDNPAHDRPHIQGVYLLIQPETLELRAIIDGTALTNVRTPAVSAAVLTPLIRRFTERVRVLVYGAGPQAVGHVAALEAIDGLELKDVTYVVRRPDRAQVKSVSNRVSAVLAAGSPEVRLALRRAHLIVCATSSSTPVFDAADLRDGAIAVAVGSHEPHAREIDGPLMGRATVVVEDVDTALREAGDVLIPVREGRLSRDALVPMADLIRGHTVIGSDQTVVFKSTGMSWQDLIVADAVMARYEAISGRRR